MTKKTFKANPAMQFINTGETKPAQTTEIDPKNIYYVPVERKSRKMNLLFRPSLYVKIAAMAEDEGLSLNEYIHRILDDYVMQKDKKHE